MSDLIRDEFSTDCTSVDHGEETLEEMVLAELNNEIHILSQVGVDYDILSNIDDDGKVVMDVDNKTERNEIPVSNQAGTDVLSTVDHGEEIIEVSGLTEEEVNHETQEEVIVPDNNSIALNIDDHGEEIMAVGGFANNRDNEEEKLKEIELAELNNEIRILNQICVDYNIFSNIFDCGKEVMEVDKKKKKNEIPVSNQAGRVYNNILSTVDHGEEMIELSWLLEKEVNHETQQEVIVPENNSMDENGEEMMEVDGFAKIRDHGEEKLKEIGSAEVNNEIHISNQVVVDFSIFPNIVDLGKEVIEVDKKKEKNEIPPSNQAGTNVLSTVDHGEEMIELSGLTEEEVNHETQQEVIVPENNSMDENGEEMMEADGFVKNRGHGEEKLKEFGSAEVNNEIHISNQVGVDYSVFSNIVDHGKEVIEVYIKKEKNEIPLSNQAGTDVLSTVDHGEEMIELSGLTEEEVNHETQEEVIVAENNSIDDNGEEIMEADGFAKNGDHGEEKLKEIGSAEVNNEIHISNQVGVDYSVFSNIVDHGKEVIEVYIKKEKNEIPLSNQAGTDVLSTVDHGEEMIELSGLTEEEVNHETQEEVIVPENNSMDENGEEIMEADGFAKNGDHGEEKLKEIGSAEVNNEIHISNQVDVDYSILPNIVDLGKEVVEVHKKTGKNEIPPSNQAGTNVLSSFDHGEEIIEVSGLTEEEVHHETQEEVVVPENKSIDLNIDDHGEEMVEKMEVNKLPKNEIEAKIPISRLVYNIGLSDVNHEEEKLTDVDALVEMEIKNKVLRYLPNLIINSVKKVENNYLAGMYYLKKEEYESRNIDVKEEILFHATAACNVDSIIGDNLVWEKCYLCKYGRGVSFASDADYANCHSNRNNGFSRAFIIAKVLIGNCTEGSSYLKIPDEGSDTTTGANGVVVVKYNHNEFLPMFVVYYDYYDITKSKYY